MLVATLNGEAVAGLRDSVSKKKFKVNTSECQSFFVYTNKISPTNNKDVDRKNVQ